MARAKAAGLSDAHVETFPGDGTTWFGTLHGNRGWRVEGGSARRSSAAAAPDHLVRRRAARGRRQQRERRRHRGARRRRRRHAAQRLRRQGRARQAGALRRDAVGLPSAGGRGARRRRPGQLQLEPGERLVARRSGSDPLGPPRRARAAERVRDHDLAARSARAAAAAGARRAHHAARGRARAQRRLDAATRRWSRRFPAPIPPPATSSSAATSITRSRAPTTTPAAAPPTSRSRARCKTLDRREAHSAAGADDPLHLAVGDDRHDRLPVEVPGDRRAHSRRGAPRHGRRRSVHHQVGAARHALAVVDRHGDRRRRGGVRALRDRRRDARRRRGRHDARDPLARRIEGRVLGRHHALRERQRSLDLSGRRLRDPVDLPARSSRHLHPHHRRSAGQHRADQDQAVGVHRRRERLLPGDDAGPRRVAAASELRERARSGWRRTAAAPSAMAAGSVRTPPTRRTSWRKGCCASSGGCDRCALLRRLHGERLDAAGATSIAQMEPGWRTRARRSCVDSCCRAEAEQLARAGFHRPAVDTRVPVRNAAVKGPLAPGGDWLREKAGARCRRDCDRAACRTATT